MRSPDGVGAIATLEAAKGALVLIAGCGLLSLVHHDAQRLAGELVAHLHLNPASHYPQIFISAATSVSDSRLMLLAGGAALYSLVRFVEAWGLWRRRRWAEWFAAVSGAIYLPFEAYELLERMDWTSAVALVVNLLVVALMYRALRQSQRSSMSHDQPST